MGLIALRVSIYFADQSECGVSNTYLALAWVVWWDILHITAQKWFLSVSVQCFIKAERNPDILGENTRMEKNKFNSIRNI